VALSKLARSLDVPATLAEAVDRSNRAEADRLAGIVKSVLPSGGTVGVLGLSYKPDTDVIEESQSIFLIKALLEDDVFVVAHDPAAMENARTALGGSVRFADSPDEVAGVADVIVIATPWREFKSLDPKLLARPGERPTIVDCWRMLDRSNLADVADYVGIGLGNASAPKRATATAKAGIVSSRQAAVSGL
jgi:UDPglucose 6-dehydrogenase